MQQRSRITPPEGFWWCNDHKKYLPECDFSFNKKKNCLNYVCKKCANKRTMVSRRKNAVSWAKNQRKWHLKNLYGITPEEFQKMFDRQKGACAICNQIKPLCIDHDHITGAMREPLCRGCNVGLGNLQDDLILVRRALDYLIGHKM